MRDDYKLLGIVIQRIESVRPVYPLDLEPGANEEALQLEPVHVSHSIACGASSHGPVLFDQIVKETGRNHLFGAIQLPVAVSLESPFRANFPFRVKSVTILHPDERVRGRVEYVYDQQPVAMNHAPNLLKRLNLVCDGLEVQKRVHADDDQAELILIKVAEVAHIPELNVHTADEVISLQPRPGEFDHGRRCIKTGDGESRLTEWGEKPPGPATEFQDWPSHDLSVTEIELDIVIEGIELEVVEWRDFCVGIILNHGCDCSAPEKAPQAESTR